MLCKTRDFGEIEITEKEIITFVQPPFGFEDFTKYTFIFDQSIGKQIVWMQSTENPEICFILFDPSPLSDTYQPKLPESIDSLLGEGELVCWTVAVIKNGLSELSINLKSPIIVNTQKNLAAQIILEQDYPVRFLLSKEVS